MTLKTPAFAVLVLAALACTDTGDQADGTATAESSAPVAASNVAQDYAPELGIELNGMRRTDSGLYIQDVQEGTGAELTAGQTAVVHYTGWLPDGTKFDSSHDRDEPFPVLVGAGRVIDGWDEGLQGMKVGGQRRLVIPPDLAYGDAGAGGVIPPDATLVFDVELLEIQE